jgi:two-component system, OmpR family, sensor histidine kinase VicK
VIYANEAVRRLLDAESLLRAGEPLPDPWTQFSLRGLAASLFTPDAANGPQLVDTDSRVLCVDSLPPGDSPTVTLLFDDVTERERTRRAERHFVENAAHELRTPLAAIVSVVDVLESGAKDDPKTRDRFLAHIRTHSERLVRLATSLLVLARIQTGDEGPHVELVAVRPLLGDVARGLTPNPGVEVKTIASSSLAALADRDLLFQALENVALNAVKHTHAGEIVLAARDLGRNVEIEIGDTGSGMERTAVDTAFDRFSRTLGREQDGFGLGLAIADDAIRALDGSISLDSTVGAGTRVRIQLPSAKIVA